MLFDTRPLGLLILIGLALLTTGCDGLSDPSSPSPRERLIGTWVIERQMEAYEVVTNAEQTVLDPDVEATGTLTLQGRWYDDGQSRPVDKRLQYVRHGARPVYQGDGRAIVISTDPVQSFEAVQKGDDEGFAVQLSDVYNTQQQVFEPDGYLEGELDAGDYEPYPGSPNLARDTLSAAPLPPAPLASSDPVLSLTALPFVSPAAEADTLYVDGQLRPAVQRLPANVATEVDVERTAPDVLDRQRITYRFTPRDSVFITATVNEDTLRTAGTWQVDGDTLRIQEADDTTTARIDFQPGHNGSPAHLRMTFTEPICRSDGNACRSFYEYTFGLEAGSLVRGSWERVNDLVALSTAEKATSVPQSSAHSHAPKQHSCSSDEAKATLCKPAHLLRGGGRSLRPRPR